MSDKLITLSLLKKVSDFYKDSFQQVPAIVQNQGTWITLSFSVDVDGDYSTFIELKGIGDKYLDSKIYYTGLHAIINNGPIKIKDAYLLSKNGASYFYLQLDHSIKQLSVSYYVANAKTVYNALTNVMVTESHTKDPQEKQLKNIYDQSEGGDTSFFIQVDDDDVIEYAKGITFDTIQNANQIAGFITVEANDEAVGKSQILRSGGTLYVPSNNYIAGENIRIKEKEISAVVPTATTEKLGGVQIGEGINVDENGIISIDSSIKAATTEKLGGVKLGKEGEGMLPLQLDAEGRAFVNEPEVHRFHIMPEPSLELSGALYQYIGETTSKFTKGYFYNCLPITRINFGGFGVLDGANPAYQLMHYLQDKTYDSGENIDFSTFFSKAYNVKFENDCWKIYDDEVSLSIPDSDLSIIGLYCKDNDFFKNAGEMEKALTFVISGEDYSWVQKDVQPIGYLNNEDLSFMTDEDVDEIFAEKVEEIKVYNSSSEQEIPEQFETTESEIYISVVPELVAYSSIGQVTIAKEEDSYKVTIAGNGSILFQSVIYPDVTKTINIIKNEETV